ncbi:hypothetical protein IFO70_03465 [Phormidium tenue FACHB-886]|nr:hypothetical protein [Phormidium tenue FACHB-886]
MSNLIHLLRSLLITSIFSFLAPILLISSLSLGLVILKHIPPMEAISQVGSDQLCNFLLIFGSGSSLRGLITLSLVSSLVSVLFDAYTFYRYQMLRDS